MSDEAGRAVGVLDSLRRLAATLLAAVQTRLELVATDIEEERAWIARMAILAALAGFCLALAINLAVLFLVVLFWDANRLLAIGVLAGVFAAFAAALGIAAKAAARRRPRLFSATLAELRKDRDDVRGP
jgi:uncharacterized membrane protein YqjE